ncbi:hypothetical protein RYH80_00590 [Halobaculum sp. MBLA0147]|uniref:hypothetical protein n=1 Tax=Halobaculum sp. MBLA0147 TaxID=3079934 RepID=UPI0035245BF7
MSERLDELRELAESDVGEPPDDPDAEVEAGGASADTATTGAPTRDAAASGATADGAGAETDESSGGLRSRLPGRPSLGLSGLFGPKRFLLALGLAVGGLVAGGAVPFVGAVTQYVGLFAAAFGYGLVASDSAYVETSVAGAVAAAVALVLNTLSAGGFVVGTDVLGRYGITLTAVGVGLGLLVSLVGHYFGRDLRAGVTRDV